MANSQAEIMLSILAKDNASGTLKNIDKNAQSMSSNISNAMSSINSSMMNFGQVTDNVMQGLTGKGALDNIFGTTSKAETNNVLLSNMLDDQEKNFDSFYKKVDETTDNSIVSMQELIPALKAFKSATGATDKEMTNVTDSIANFGAAVLAQTGSTDLAQQSMMDLSKGVKGAYASLDQYGITEDALKRTGYWNGDEKDVEGFMKAVTDVTGSTEELMETNQGLDALIGKAFSRAGKKMGNEFLPVLKDIKRGFLDLDDSLDGGLSGSILAISGGVELMNQGLWNVSTTVQGFKDLKEGISSVRDVASGAASALKSFGKNAETASIAGDTITNAAAHANGGFSMLPEGFNPADLKKDTEAIEEIVEDSSKVGALAPEAGAAATGVEATGGIMSGLSAAFTSMIVPLLAISAVIIIMIPIVTFIAAEAMVFLKLLQEFMASLNFGGIDLSGSIKGITQIAHALLMVGAAMAAMTFASIMTGIAVVTGGFLGITGPLEIAKDALMDAAKKLQEFSGVQISTDIPAKIQAISDGLKSVSDAMMALTNVTVTTGFGNFVAWAFQFSSTTDAMKQAQTEISEAASMLNGFSFPNIDTSVIDRLTSVCNALASVGDAMDGLRSLRDSQNWDNAIGGLMEGIFGSGVNIQEALTAVKQDIIDASSALAEFTGVSDIPQDVADKIKKVGDTLKSVGEAMESLRSMRDDFNWDEGLGGIFSSNDIAGTIDKVKSTIESVASKLASLSINAIPEGVGENIKKVTSTLKTVMEAITELNNVQGTNISDDASLIKQAISDAKTVLSSVASDLAGLNDISSVDEGVATKIQTVTSTLKQVSAAITEMNGVQSLSIDKDTLTTTVGDAIDVVNSVTGKLKALGETDSIGEDIGSRIQTVSTAIQQLSTATQNMVNVPQPPDGLAEKIHLAVESVKAAITELSGLSESTMGADITSILSSVSNAVTQLQTTLTSMSGGFVNAGSSIGSSLKSGIQTGLSGLNSVVTSAVSGAVSGAAGTATSGGNTLGSNMTNGFKSNLKLADVMTTEMGYVKSAVDSGIDAAVSAAQSGAEKVVEAFKNGINVGSPGDIARTMSGEMAYTLDAIKGSYYSLKNASNTAARTIVDSFGNPTLGYDSFLNSNFDINNMGALGTALTPVSNQPVGNSVTIIVNEGAVSVDARNKTTQEARQIMITALESLDNIKDVVV